MTFIPRTTVRDWLKSRPAAKEGHAKAVAKRMIASLPWPEYSYLLGLTSGTERSRSIGAASTPSYRRCDSQYTEIIAARWNRWDSVSIARAPSVAILDSFIRPKA